MRYQGSDSQLMIPSSKDGNFLTNFEESHMREFGFTDDSRKVIVDDVRVRASGSTSRIQERSYQKDLETLSMEPVEHSSTTKHKNVYFYGG